MRRIFVFTLIVALLSASATLAADPISEDSCRNLAKRFEALSNTNPSRLAQEAPQTLEILKQGETPNYYFICYNIYVENLFNQGHVSLARKEIKKMVEEAVQMQNAECITVARRAEGQFYYKIGMYTRAAECFRKGMEACPNYKKLRSYFTYSSTATWLVRTDMHIGQWNEARQWVDRVGGMMLWLKSQNRADPTGHNQVMTLALKAQIALRDRKSAWANALLDSCTHYMRPELPKRAYVEYYVGLMKMNLQLGRRDSAVQLLDTLIEIHRTDYRPISLEFMKQKADLLNDMGRHDEAATIYRDYIAEQRKIDDLAIAQQLDEMRTKYEVDQLQSDVKQAEHEKQFIFVICVLLALLLIGVGIYYFKMRAVNHVLVNHIREIERQNTLDKERKRAMKSQKESDRLSLGYSVMQFFIDELRFLQADGGKAEVLEKFNISERTLLQALAASTGLSFSGYINKLRLEYSVSLLERDPKLTVKQIAERCGYGTVRQYQRLFKIQYGISPTTYKSER